MQQVLGPLVSLLIFAILWSLANIAKRAQDKNAQEMQKKRLAAQQQNDANRAVTRKAYRQVEAFNAMVSAPTESEPPPLKRPSVFDETTGGEWQVPAAPEWTADSPPITQHASEQTNPIAQEILARMTTPQSLQHVVVLSDILNRPKFE